MAVRRKKSKSTQKPPRRPGKVKLPRFPADLPFAPEPAEGQLSFDLEVEEEKAPEGVRTHGDVSHALPSTS